MGHGHSHNHGGHSHGAHDHGVHGHAGHHHVGHGPGGHPPAGSDGGGPGAASSRRALRWALGLNGIFLVVELVVGWSTGSLAVLSDAVHMVSDVGGLVLALWAAQVALRPASVNRTFGLLRAEVLGAFANALLLLVAVFFIFKEAVERIVEGPPAVAVVPVFVTGLIGLAVNLGSAWGLSRVEDGNLNIRGALLHMLADALGSVGACLAAVGSYFGLAGVDPLVGILVGLLVLWGTWGLARDSSRVLLQFAPDGVRSDEVEAALSTLPGVAEVHDLHLWSVGGRDGVLTAHLVLREGASGPVVRGAAEEMLMARFSVRHSTLQLEEAEVELRCSQRVCHLLPPAPLDGAGSGV